MPARVALVEDNPALRRRFVERFRFFSDVELILSAGSGEEFLDRLRACQSDGRPQVVLMDIELPGMSGIEATARVRELYPEMEIVMLTVFEDEDKIFASIQSGASGYLLKESSTDVIVGAVLEMLQGGAPMSPAVARKMLGYVRSNEQAAAPSGAFNLSEREHEILERLMTDETEQVIADRLFISPHTVRAHIKSIYKKLHVHSRASAVRIAVERRLFSNRRPA